jgi:hypothetical protein
MALQTRRTALGGQAASEIASGHWLMLAVLLLGQFMCIIDGLVPSSEHASPHVRTYGSRLGREGTQPRGGSPRALRRSSVFWNRL